MDSYTKAFTFECNELYIRDCDVECRSLQIFYQFFKM